MFKFKYVFFIFLVFLTKETAFSCLSIEQEIAQEQDAEVLFEGKVSSYELKTKSGLGGVTDGSIAKVTFEVTKTLRGSSNHQWTVLMRGKTLPNSLSEFIHQFGDFHKVGLRKLSENVQLEIPSEYRDLMLIVDAVCSLNKEDWLIQPMTINKPLSIKSFINFILHLDQYLAQWTRSFGVWIYLILFLIIFAETGFVFTPFLPGDSLLFAAGAIATLPQSNINVHFLALLLLIAAIAGDFVNYSIGKSLGPKIFSKEDSWLLNKKHLLKTQSFYEKYGSKTIVIARFAPIIRTFAPFVAGIGKMNYSKFISYNALGGFLWIYLFLYAGYFFGNLPTVKKNFHLIIISVIGLSLLPIAVGWIQSYKRKLGD